MVDTSGLRNVIRIDRENKTVLVEPNVPMDAPVGATMKHGLVPPVVTEFPGITGELFLKQSLPFCFWFLAF